MASTLKQTPLHSRHREQQANMAAFAGYEMPLWYPAGVKQEHLSVIEKAGLFDTSHMACLLVYGDFAFDLLQYTFSRDLAALQGRPNVRLAPGACAYGVFLDEVGHVIDDALVYKITDNRYMVVVNAGMGNTITGHLADHQNGRKIAITDLTDQVGKLDIQGPLSAKILSRVLVNPDQVLADMVYFQFKGDIAPDPAVNPIRMKDDCPLLLSRSGYTGEFGFELFMPADRLAAVWESLLEAGRDQGLQVCGLAARDSLRTGAVLPLSHQDIGDWLFRNNPWEFALPFAAGKDRFTKSFIGDQALLSGKAATYTYPFVGFDPRKIVPDTTVVLDEDGHTIGQVLTCTTDMAIGFHKDQICSLVSPDKPDGFQPRGLACGFVRIEKPLPAGSTVTLADQRRRITVRITKDIRPDRTARRAIRKLL